LLAHHCGVQVVHRGGDIVGVAVAGAEDDGLLVRATVLVGVHDLREQVQAHGVHSVGQEQFGLELLLLVQVGDLGGGDGAGRCWRRAGCG
jgi:hypothetical protein